MHLTSMFQRWSMQGSSVCRTDVISLVDSNLMALVCLSTAKYSASNKPMLTNLSVFDF